jgi:hypothetical protein
MSSYLHQIFYNYNKFDNEESLSQINDFVLTNNRKQMIIDAFNANAADLHEVKTQKQNNEIKSDNDIYFSNKQNPLFWSVYINIYGYEKYMQISNKYGNVELEEKQKIIEFLKNGYSKLKQVNKKVTKTIIQEWMSELMSASKISIPLLQLFSVYYKKNIIIYNEINNTYLKFLAGIDENDNLSVPMIVVKNRNNNYGLYIDITYEKINELMNGVCLEDIEKPLNGISSYKMPELIELAKKCGIQHDQINKPELYGKIWNHLQVAYNK